MKRSLAIAATTMVLLLASASGAFAADSYGTMPGATVSQSHTVCAGAGAFGAFGPGTNWGQDPPGPAGPSGHGADGQLTGSSNSSLCGSPQGNP